ncbi:nuclear transport factor 2 family protein [Nocardia sp. CA2R105]|uniref:nuclear transport factor 2 family protein n=1 Tax=Nocardia coffeae TaxID=2873381 RepID=UPI001CA7A66F|nr:nuclear transport factor 2 family protein [Nocardia coffeae]MBY8860394.1 nuclear transport factor 2 family protein [Nocardia coffeae]
MTTPEQNIEITNRFAEAFSTGDVDTLLELLSDQAVYWVAGGIEGLSGNYDKNAFGELIRGVKDAYKQGALKITPTAAIAQGDKVAVEADSFAELTDGRIYSNQYHFLFQICDGKILHVKEYMDTHHAFETFVS